MQCLRTLTWNHIKSTSGSGGGRKCGSTLITFLQSFVVSTIRSIQKDVENLNIDTQNNVSKVKFTFKQLPK
jgi:hypothetical protein